MKPCSGGPRAIANPSFTLVTRAYAADVDEPGHIAGQVGFMLTMLGVVLIMLSGIPTMVKGGYASSLSFRSFALRPWSPLSRRLHESARGNTPIPPEELPVLQAAARIWVGQRWQLLFCLGASIAQFGSNLASLGPRRYPFTAAFTTLMMAMAVFIERRARLGVALLARYPMSLPSNPPEHLGGPQPSSR